VQKRDVYSQTRGKCHITDFQRYDLLSYLLGQSLENANLNQQNVTLLLDTKVLQMRVAGLEASPDTVCPRTSLIHLRLANCNFSQDDRLQKMEMELDENRSRIAGLSWELDKAATLRVSLNDQIMLLQQKGDDVCEV
jgi:hypothetical protein